MQRHNSVLRDCTIFPEPFLRENNTFRMRWRTSGKNSLFRIFGGSCIAKQKWEEANSSSPPSAGRERAVPSAVSPAFHMGCGLSQGGPGTHMPALSSHRLSAAMAMLPVSGTACQGKGRGCLQPKGLGRHCCGGDPEWWAGVPCVWSGNKASDSSHLGSFLAGAPYRRSWPSSHGTAGHSQWPGSPFPAHLAGAWGPSQLPYWSTCEEIPVWFG